MRQHVTKVAESQKIGKRLSVHYLSADSQNEFISACAHHVRQEILAELRSSMYYSIIVDTTPDSLHIEQTTFILRYVSMITEKAGFEVQVQFLGFVDCDKKV